MDNDSVKSAKIQRMMCDYCEEPFEVGMNLDNEEVIFLCGCDGYIPKTRFVEGMKEKYNVNSKPDQRGMYQ